MIGEHDKQGLVPAIAERARKATDNLIELCPHRPGFGRIDPVLVHCGIEPLQLTDDEVVAGADCAYERFSSRPIRKIFGRRRCKTSDVDRSRPGLNDVPTTATRVDEGDSARLSYSPAREGTLYVYDALDDRVIFSSPVRAGERFVLDPDANRATVDGRTVLGTGLNPRHQYRLYFDRGLGA